MIKYGGCLKRRILCTFICFDSPLRSKATIHLISWWNSLSKHKCKQFIYKLDTGNWMHLIFKWIWCGIIVWLSICRMNRLNSFKSFGGAEQKHLANTAIRYGNSRKYVRWIVCVHAQAQAQIIELSYGWYDSLMYFSVNRTQTWSTIWVQWLAMDMWIEILYIYVHQFRNWNFECTNQFR